VPSCVSRSWVSASPLCDPITTIVNDRCSGWGWVARKEGGPGCRDETLGTRATILLSGPRHGVPAVEQSRPRGWLSIGFVPGVSPPVSLLRWFLSQWCTYISSIVQLCSPIDVTMPCNLVAHFDNTENKRERVETWSHRDSVRGKGFARP